MADPVRLPPAVALVSGGPGDLVGLGVEHRVEDLRHLFGDQPVEPGLEQVLVDLYDVRVSWFRLLASNRGFCFGEGKSYTGRGPCPLTSGPESESAQEFGRYRKSQTTIRRIL